jgi:hypothetical protein
MSDHVDWQEDLFGGKRKSYTDKEGKKVVMYQSEDDVAENARRRASGGKSEYPHHTLKEGESGWHYSNTEKGARVEGMQLPKDD